MNGRRGKVYIKNKTRHELNYFYHSYSKTMTYRSIYMLFYVFEIVFFFFQDIFKMEGRSDPIQVRFEEIRSDVTLWLPCLYTHITNCTFTLHHPVLYQTPLPHITFPD